jgi:NAD(P)H-dependent FMN reductase
MSYAPRRLAVITASVRDGRFGPTVASWFLEQAEQFGEFEVDTVDLHEVDLPLVMSSPPTPEAIAALGRITPVLERADAFVVVTPEYNHSFPASLKNAIDWHFTQWQAKPVGFVAYGGLAGGLRAVEQLRQVFAELHAVTVRDTVSFHGGAGVFGGDGRPLEPAGCASAAKTMLVQLSWWASALREAKQRRPYGA